MKVACASCQTPLDAERTPAGSEAPLCDDCSKAASSPRGRPRVPDMSFAPRGAPGASAPRGDAERSKPKLDVARVSAAATPASKGERLSLGEIAPETSGGPKLLDGGFDSLSQHGEYTTDAEPVSLLDLGRVLGPTASPPAWSGVSEPRVPAASRVRMPTPGGVRVPSPGGASARLTLPGVTAPRVPDPVASSAPVASVASSTPVASVASTTPVASVASSARVAAVTSSKPVGSATAIAPVASSAPAAASTPAARSAPPADVARVPVEAVPSKKARPRFFEVDSVPPPSEKAPISVEPPRHSGHDDLRVLMAGVPDRRASRPDEDLTALRGALFANAPPRAPALPSDLSLLLPDLPGDEVEPDVRPAAIAPVARPAPIAPVLTPGRAPRPPRPPSASQPEIAPRPAAVALVGAVAADVVPVDVVPVDFVPVDVVPADAVTAAPPTPRYVPRSGAHTPVVAGRRPAATAAARRSGVANWVVGVASVSAVGLVVALRFGMAASDPAVDEAAPRDRVSVSPPPPVTAAPVETATAASPAPPPTAVAAVPAVVADPARAAARREAASPVATSRPVERPAAPPPAAGGGEFSAAAARAALAAAAGAAAACKQPTDPSGGGRVSVTFAPSGRATSAQLVGPPFQGTRTGGCIAAAFRSATVPPFAGDPVVVTKEVRIR